ncbi:MAG: hypothetical protein VX151_00970, partial [Candidatus Thermoplasmatota archaeon]|nr:hypothetical protein [Candidatus Thermoplasmatota archaeon]
ACDTPYLSTNTDQGAGLILSSDDAAQGLMTPPIVPAASAVMHCLRMMSYITVESIGKDIKLARD